MAFMPAERQRAPNPIKTGQAERQAERQRAPNPVKTGQAERQRAPNPIKTGQAERQRAPNPVKTGKMGHHTHMKGTQTSSFSSLLWMSLSLFVNVCLIQILLPAHPQRTQNSKFIPTHVHLQPDASGSLVRHQYQTRTCNLCQPPGATGSERHYLTSCPQVQGAREQAIRSVAHILPYMNLPKWQSITNDDRIRFLSASCLPTRLQQSRIKRSLWMAKIVNIAALLATSVHSSLLPE
jgi:hypothetical protein